MNKKKVNVPLESIQKFQEYMLDYFHVGIDYRTAKEFLEKNPIYSMEDLDELLNDINEELI